MNPDDEADLMLTCRSPLHLAAPTTTIERPRTVTTAPPASRLPYNSAELLDGSGAYDVQVGRYPYDLILVVKVTEHHGEIVLLHTGCYTLLLPLAYEYVLRTSTPVSLLLPSPSSPALPRSVSSHLLSIGAASNYPALLPRHSPVMASLTLLLTASAASLFFQEARSAATCYHINGSLADSSHQPCNPDAEVSACCATNKKYPDLCLSSGLCMAQEPLFIGLVFSDGCTDESGLSDECPHFCPDRTYLTCAFCDIHRLCEVAWLTYVPPHHHRQG